jgi:hypothetical protein
MTNQIGHESLTDFTFLHAVYRHRGVDTHPGFEEATANRDEASRIAGRLFEELEHRGRGDFPRLELPDPGKRLEKLAVRLAVMSFEAIERKNLLEPIWPAEGIPRVYKKADIDARVTYKDDPVDEWDVGSLTIVEEGEHPTIEEVRLDRYLGHDKVVKGFEPGGHLDASQDYEALNFLGMIATYLSVLEEQGSTTAR